MADDQDRRAPRRLSTTALGTVARSAGVSDDMSAGSAPTAATWRARAAGALRLRPASVGRATARRAWLGDAPQGRRGGQCLDVRGGAAFPGRAPGRRGSGAPGCLVRPNRPRERAARGSACSRRWPSRWRTNGIARPSARTAARRVGCIADDRDPHVGVAQLPVDVDLGHGHEPDARVGDLARDDGADLLAQQLVEPFGPLTHGQAALARGAGHCLLAEALDDVALFEVRVVGEADAALVARSPPHGRHPGSDAGTRCDRWSPACRRGRRGRGPRMSRPSVT